MISMTVTQGKVIIQEDMNMKVKPSKNVHMLMTNSLMVIMTIEIMTTETEMMIIGMTTI